MAIQFQTENKIFKLDTNNTSYLFCVSNLNVLEHLYYGAKIENIDVRCISNRQVYSFAVVNEQ